ncbi:MAG: hypothetical protein GY777_14420 [Candidatus Brocadiaceae bacterium]|nr:hypothetical protein [Candidatus Brocadiaceae bacterium]
MRKIIDNNKLLNIVILSISLIFVALALYACFFIKRASLDVLIIVILFFGTGAIVTIIDMKAKHKGMFAKRENLSDKQNFAEVICGFVFSLCSLWAAITGKFSNSNFTRIVLFFGFLFFFIGSIWLLVKGGKGSDSKEEEESEQKKKRG